tara:strand:+ start:252 stop:437 length:186 start_codon:yes stop_codon:yes gene_type:complete
MDDLMKTTLLLIESEQRNIKLQKQVNALQNSEDWWSSYSTYISEAHNNVDNKAIEYANKSN